jgi:hypothetical protein
MIVGRVLLHHVDRGHAGVQPAPTGRERMVLTWPSDADPRHIDTLSCWCRPRVIPIRVDAV